MISLKDEINKFKPILELDKVEDELYAEEVQDMIDILKNMNTNTNSR